MSAGGWFQTIFVLTCVVLIVGSYMVRAGRVIDRVKRRFDREFPDDDHPLWSSGIERRRRD